MSEASSHLLFEVISGKALGTTITVEDELVIGRHADGAGRLSEDEEISRQHARISREVTGDYAIEDLGSSNGTFVNGLRIQSPRLLSLGDSIETGATTLVVKEIVRPEPVEAAPPTADTPAAPSAPDTTNSPNEPDVTAPSARSAPTSARSTVTPQQAASAVDPSPDPDEAAGRTPRLKLRLDVDFDAREARITLGGDGETVRMVLEDGDWRAVSTGLDADE
jgi:pSer/pThr/pTyr-binding forkhead associated (FHA) protein